MGLYQGNLANYYATPSLETLGGYQFISITDVINNFMVAYVGEDKILPRISRADVRFHAGRAMQELTYDTFRSCKTLELEVANSLTLPIPHDYVDYVKISRIDASGNCHTLNHCKSCPKDPLSYKQHPDGTIDVGEKGTSNTHQVLVRAGYGTGKFDREGDGDTNNPTNWTNWVEAVYETVTEHGNYLPPTAEPSNTWASQSSTTNTTQSYNETEMLLSNNGRRYGLNTADANVNGCFYVNCRNGKIYFDSSLIGKTITIQYISDGVATDGEMLVHKFAEEAMYKWIIYAILSTRSAPDPRASVFKKERSAAIRNAKLRLSKIKPEELAKVLRGKSKWIKH